MIDWKKSRSIPEWLSWAGAVLIAVFVVANPGLQQDLMNLWDSFVFVLLSIITEPVNSYLYTLGFMDAHPLTAYLIIYLLVSHAIFVWLLKK